MELILIQLYHQMGTFLPNNFKHISKELILHPM